jgi:hypothetical protein
MDEGVHEVEHRVAMLEERHMALKGRPGVMTSKSDAEPVCACCLKPHDGPMLRDDIWLQLADAGERFLCDTCMHERAQQRLGRRLRLADLSPCRFNLWWFDTFAASEPAEPINNIAAWRDAARASGTTLEIFAPLFERRFGPR